jgi:putative endonuclease
MTLNNKQNKSKDEPEINAPSPDKSAVESSSRINQGSGGSPWHLYLLECRNGALYAGITTNVARRYGEHASGKGAKYTRANPPVRIVGSREFDDRSSASRAEAAVRRLPASKKPGFLLEK